MTGLPCSLRPVQQTAHCHPSTTLHGWLVDSMREVLEATPPTWPPCFRPLSVVRFFSLQYATAKSSLLFYSATHAHLTQAIQHRLDAFLTAAKQMRKHDGGAALAHAKAISAPQCVGLEADGSHSIR